MNRRLTTKYSQASSPAQPPKGGTPNRCRAFSLIEIMVSVTLLSLIVIGLLSVFNYTQRALRFAHNQTDVSEGARAVVDLLSRDLLESRASDDTNCINFYSADIGAPVQLPRPGGGYQTNVVQDFYFLSRRNDDWFATGYFLDQGSGGLVGTLYRFSAQAPWYGTNYSSGTNYDRGFLTNWFNMFRAATANANIEAHRVVDGVVHLQARAYDAKGRLHDPFWLDDYYYPEMTNSIGRQFGSLAEVSNVYTQIFNNIEATPTYFTFKGEFLPAYVELEIGILEPEATRQFNLINDANSSAGISFLTNQAGRIHLFRQRIPVRNHVQPEALF